MDRRAGSKHASGVGRRLFALAVPLALVSFASGCVATGPVEWIRNGFKVGPNYQKPPAPVAPEWISAKEPGVENRHLQEWWQVFEDPTLNSLVTTAYGQNLTLRAAGLRVLEACAQWAIAAGNLFPQTQQATGHYSRVGLSQNAANNPTAFSPLLTILPGASTLLPPESIPRNFFSDWQVGFNLSWELDFWGRFRRAVESASDTLDASVENFDDALVTLLADTATNYVQYRVTQERIRIANDNVRIQEGILALTQERYRVGTATVLDVQQAQTILEQTRSTIPALKIALGQANDALSVLLGIPPRDLAAELGPGAELGANPMAHTPSWVAAGIPADLLRRRPDVRAAERQVAAQSAQIGVAEADLYPAIYIDGTLGYEAQDIRRLFESRSFMGNITPNFKWNILNYGRIQNNVRLQQTRTQELIALYQNKVLTAAREVEDALRGFVRSQEQAEDLSKSVQAAAAATKTGIQQYRTGTIPFNTVFQLETAQVVAQDQLALAQGNIALNLVNVYRALGGGWELRLPPEARGRLDNPAASPACAAQTETGSESPTSRAMASADVPAGGPPAQLGSPRPVLQNSPPVLLETLLHQH
jgi:NodT family efflux transporter outer membrane factor (OMF) lipoprotein